ncbi:MAG: hypothetical protein ACYS9C_01280 [Planctomycetota bacterium]|jgi:hypothetical protein
METNEKHKRQIERIINEKKCPKDFECYKSGLENLCRAKNIGLRDFVECLEKNPQMCKFSLSFGYSYFCQCPVRIYIVKELGK